MKCLLLLKSNNCTERLQTSDAGMATEFDSYAEGYLCNALTIRDDFANFLPYLGKLRHAYGKVFTTRWQSLPIRWQNCQLVGKKSKIHSLTIFIPISVSNSLRPPKLLWHSATSFAHRLISKNCTSKSLPAYPSRRSIPPPLHQVMLMMEQRPKG